MNSLLSINDFVREFDTPNLTNWKLFAKSPSLTVYQQVQQKRYYYKFFTHLPDVKPEVLYQVILDMEYRMVWDKFLKEGKKISDEDKQGVYWQIIMPLFLSNRDYTFVQQNSEHDIDNRHFYYIGGRCEPFKTELPRKKVVRIEDCQSETLISSDGANGLKSLMIYYEDPRGSFPKVAWSWAAKFGIPMYAKLTHNACKTYPQWIKDKKTVVPNVIEDMENEAAAAAALIPPTDSTADNDNNQVDENQKE